MGSTNYEICEMMERIVTIDATLISFSKGLHSMKKEFERLESLHVKALRMHAHLCWHIRNEINICRQAG